MSLELALAAKLGGEKNLSEAARNLEAYIFRYRQCWKLKELTMLLYQIQMAA
jgi:hypothetical protein